MQDGVIAEKSHIATEKCVAFVVIYKDRTSYAQSPAEEKYYDHENPGQAEDLIGSVSDAVISDPHNIRIIY